MSVLPLTYPLPEELYNQLLKNGLMSLMEDEGSDHWPVAKFVTLDGDEAWLLTEIDPDDPGKAFALCDDGNGFPELDIVTLSLRDGIPRIGNREVVQVEYFKAVAPISVYAQAAFREGRIVNVDAVPL